MRSRGRSILQVWFWTIATLCSNTYAFSQEEPNKIVLPIIPPAEEVVNIHIASQIATLEANRLFGAGALSEPIMGYDLNNVPRAYLFLYKLGADRFPPTQLIDEELEEARRVLPEAKRKLAETRESSLRLPIGLRPDHEPRSTHSLMSAAWRRAESEVTILERKCSGIGEYATIAVSARRDLAPILGYGNALPPFFLGRKELERQARDYLHDRGMLKERLYLAPTGKAILEFRSPNEERAWFSLPDKHIVRPDSTRITRTVVTENEKAWIDEKWEEVTARLRNDHVPAAPADVHYVDDDNQAVPAFLWAAGCAPTSAAMVLGYWDSDSSLPDSRRHRGYGKLVDYYSVRQNIASYMECGHEEDAFSWGILDVDPGGLDGIPGTVHSLACEMETNAPKGTTVSNYLNRPIQDGILALTVSMGYSFSVVEDYTGWNYEAIWAKIRTEIDNDRPCIWSRLGSWDAGESPPDEAHSVAVIGYSDDGFVFYRSTWDFGSNWSDPYQGDGYGPADIAAVVPGGGSGENDIALIAPDGGESWFGGTIHNVDWYQYGTSIDNVSIYYSIDGGYNWSLIASDISSAPGLNNYLWTIPCNESPYFFVRIVAYSGNTYIAGEGSEDRFAVYEATSAVPALNQPPNNAMCQGTSGMIDWQDVELASEYTIQIGTSPGSGYEYSVTSSQYCHQSLLPNTTYYWRVKAKCPCGAYGSYSSCYSFTTASSPLYMAPTNCSASQDRCDGILLHWDWRGGAVSGFEIRRDHKLIETLAYPNVEQWLDNDPELSFGTHEYTICAYDNCADNVVIDFNSGSSCGTLVPPYTFETGASGLEFKSTGGYIVYGDNELFSRDVLQIEFRVMFTSLPNDLAAGLVTKYEHTEPGTSEWGIFVEADGRWMLTGKGTDRIVSVADAASAGIAYLVRAVLLGSWGELYVDDVLVASGTVTRNVDTATPLVIGNTNTRGNTFQGVIDEIRITSSRGPACVKTGTRAQPTTPSNCVSAPPQCDGILLSWDYSGSAQTGFKVKRDGSLVHAGTDESERSWLDAACPSGPHSYSIWAYDNCGDGPSCIAAGYRRPVPLASPTLQYPPSGAPAEPPFGTLRWAAVDHAQSYRVRIGSACGEGSEYEANSNGCTYAKNGTKCYWQVQAKDSCGHYGECSECDSFTTVDDLRLVACAGLYADTLNGDGGEGHSHCSVYTSHGFQEVEMWVWFRPSNRGLTAAEFKIMYPTTTYIIQGAVTSNPINQVELGSLAGGIRVEVGEYNCQTDWYWSYHQTLVIKKATPSPSVQIVGHPGNGGHIYVATCEPPFPFYDVEVLNALALNSPAPPVPASPSSGAPCMATTGTLDWPDVTDATAYVVQLGTTCDFVDDSLVSSSSFPYSGLLPYTTYNWRVASKNSCKQLSPFSACGSFTTAPPPLAPPSLESPPNNSTNQSCCGDTLRWSSVPGATGYKVQLGNKLGAGEEHDVESSQTQFQYYVPGGKCYWRVKTKDSCGQYGSYSSSDSFSTTQGPDIPYVALYVDTLGGPGGANHSQASLYVPAPYTSVEIWVWFYPSTRGLAAAEFKIMYPTTTYIIQGAVTSNPINQVEFGSLGAGIDVSLGEYFCQQGWYWTHWQEIVVKNITTAREIAVVGHPTNGGHIYVASCEPGFPFSDATVLNQVYLNQQDPTIHPLPAPVLRIPPAGEPCAPADGSLDWDDVNNARGYIVQLGDSCGVGTDSIATSSSLEYRGLLPGTKYYWRVAASGRCDTGTFSFSACDSFIVSDWRDVTNEATGGSLHGFGTAWGDYNNDGYLDLYISNDGPNRLCENAAGIFADMTSGPLGDSGRGRGAVWGDYDNDGRLDLFLANNIGHNRLFHNEGIGSFTAVDLNYFQREDATFGAAWVDHDNDGDLDLYYANAGSDTCRLLTNDGGVFVDEHTASCIEDIGECVGVAWGDYDNDGLQDLYLSKWGASNKLFHNDGLGSFSDATSGPLARAGNGQGIAWADYDNDGNIDLLMADNGGGCRLLHNDGRGNFTDATSGDLGGPRFVRGVAWGDYDNDGDLDIYLSCVGENLLLRNDGGNVFVDVTYGELSDSGDTRAVAWGDYDNDGRLDLYVVNDGSGNKLLQNLTRSGNHWIEIDLRGTRSNRSAIGARVRIVAGGIQQIREVSGGNGYLSQDPLRVHFGLGASTLIDTLQVTWPRIPKRIYTARDLGVDRILAIEEDYTATDVSVPTTCRLYPAYPNPFNPTTTFEFDVSQQAGKIAIRIFDVRGTLIRELVNERLSPGRHNCIWNGTDAAGKKVSSGVYLCQLQTAVSNETKKIVILR